MPDPVIVESGISLTATVLSGLAVAAGGLASYFGMRVQRDMAKLKNEILDGINGKYISRKESEILAREDERWKQDMTTTVKEARKQHHVLHEEFIACRAARGAAERE